MTSEQLQEQEKKQSSLEVALNKYTEHTNLAISTKATELAKSYHVFKEIYHGQDQKIVKYAHKLASVSLSVSASIKNLEARLRILEEMSKK